jgi:parallel beta-helix repeat protein
MDISRNFGLAVFLLLITGLPATAVDRPPTSAVQRLIDDAIAQKKTQVALPAGVVRVGKGLRVTKADGLLIDGSRTTLVVTTPSEMALHVSRSREVMVYGLTIDYDPLPFTQGTIVAKADDRSWFEFEVHAGYPDLTDDYLVRHVHLFEADKAAWKRDVPDLYPRKTLALSERRGRLEFSRDTAYLDRVSLGDRVVLNQRVANAIKFTQCENVRVEQVTVLAGPGCGLIARYMRGKNYFQFDIHPGPTPVGATQSRLMSTCADGFNYAFARRGPVLENAHFSFMGDDAVNLHGPTFLVVDKPEPTELLVGFPYSNEPIEWLVAPKDQARGLRAGTYAPVGLSLILRCQREPKPTSEQLDLIHQFWPRLARGRGDVYRLTLAQPLEVQRGDALDIPAVNAPRFRITGCEFRDHRARGILIGSSEGCVENNTLERLKNIGIKVDPGYVFWREAGWAEDVLIRNNRLIDVGRSPCAYQPKRAALGAISVTGEKESPDSSLPFADGNQNIVIEGNQIDGCSVAGIFVRCAKNVVVRNNRVSHTNYADAPDAGSRAGFDVTQPVDVRASGKVEMTDNQVDAVGSK